MSSKPGNLKPEEIDSLVYRPYFLGATKERPLWFLYLIGRYLEHCGEQEKAVQTYHRLLASRCVTTDSEFVRCLTVQRLRKSGLTKEEYLKAFKSDPQRLKSPISRKLPDTLCRQLFRDFSLSPLESQLARPVLKNVKNTDNDFGTPRDFEDGYYRTTKISFRGQEIPENETVVYWNLRRHRVLWDFLGTASSGSLPVKTEKRDENDFHKVLLGRNDDTLHARAYFYEGKAVLVISLQKDKEPDSPFPAPESDCVRIEMKRLGAPL